MAKSGAQKRAERAIARAQSLAAQTAATPGPAAPVVTPTQQAFANPSQATTAAAPPAAIPLARQAPLVPYVPGAVPQPPVVAARVAGPNPLRGVAGVSDAEADELLAKLAEINGQDFYSARTAAVGRLNAAEYLVLPAGLVVTPCAAADVGKAANPASVGLTLADRAAIYALNKTAAPAGTDGVKFAVLRLCLVEAGWYVNETEVRREPAPADSLRVFVTDRMAVTAALPTARELALVLPLATEHTFRTMGHHFISGLEREYLRRYKATFRACLMPDADSWLPASSLFHVSSHWVGPARAHNVLMSGMGDERFPRAILIRATATPAGYALVGTSSAILECMATSGLKDALEVASGVNLQQITDASDAVKADARKYHAAYFAYGVAKASDSEVAAVEAAAVAAKRLAPVLQGFLDSLSQDSDLSRAKALAKHANVAPIQRKNAMRFFRALARAEPTSLDELFTTETEVEV